MEWPAHLPLVRGGGVSVKKLGFTMLACYVRVYKLQLGLDL